MGLAPVGLDVERHARELRRWWSDDSEERSGDARTVAHGRRPLAVMPQAGRTTERHSLWVERKSDQGAQDRGVQRQ